MLRGLESWKAIAEERFHKLVLGRKNLQIVGFARRKRAANI